MPSPERPVAPSPTPADRARSRNRAIGLAIVLAVLLAAIALWLLLRPEPAPAPPLEPPAVEIEPEPEPELPPELVLEPASFADLPGWEEGDQAAALPAFLASCRVFLRGDAGRSLGADGVAGTAADWRPLCRRARELPADDDGAVRRFFEESFRVFAMADRDEPEGLFTGYYEPSLRGSTRRGGPYQVPLYRRPPELVEVDLGSFRDDLAGRRIAGRVTGGRLEPYADRTAIEEGALAGRGLELLWVDDPVDSFFLQIQGSGRVELPDGSEVRVGYAGQNGHPYYAIGRELVERGELARDEVSLQSIRRWLAENPEEGVEVMRTNASYVFFRRLDRDGPVGSQGVVLTPGRSLAVDRRFVPMGVPLWLAATAPSPTPGEPDRPLERLVVAQDTGGAIRGPVRGDVFWGAGEDAEEVAGRMQNRGRLWMLLPRELDPAGS